MKKKSASQSAFFNLRVLVGLFIALAGVFLLLLGFGGFSAQAQQSRFTSVKPADPLVPALFDCSKIHELGIDRQENFRAGAIMIHCGEAVGGSGDEAEGGPASRSGASKSSKFMQKLLAPLAFGAADVNLITTPEISPNVTQSETYTAANPDDPNQIFVAYNDSRGRNASPINISGASISTDGGTTFTRITTVGGQSPFTGTVGDPVALYHKPSGTWFTIWLDTACGSQGLGGYKSATPANAASWTHFCVHNASNDDRESGWADNNPASPFFGRMYVSWGASAGLVVTRSTDGGLTWTAPITVAPASPFIRNVQITGDMTGNGDLYIAGMNENGGNTNFNRNNLIFRSTDGGATWTNTYTGPAFQGPGVTNSGYFACMFSDGGGYWRHEGWGQPAAFNHVVSLVYASRVGAPPADAGDIFYIRSTDSGVTFGAPFKLNSDATIRPQWQPNLSASPTGTLFATWYDARDSANCTRGSTGVPCYRMYSRKSNDNGVSWLPDDAFSDVVTPLPAQNDPGIQATYAGDYDYGSAIASKHVTSWTDGRVAINASSQQDAFTDREQVGFAATTTTPTCGSILFSQPTDFVINLTDAVNPGDVQATDFTVDGAPANSFVLSNGNTTITFHYNASPVGTQGTHTMHIPAGAFTRVSDSQANLDFTCTFRYDAQLLQVTTTVPPAGGTFSAPAPGSYTYDVNFNEAVDPASVQTGDLTLSGNTGATVFGVSMINGNTTARFTLNIGFGGNLTANLGTGAVADQFGNPGAAFSANYLVAGCPPPQYTITPGADTIVPGTIDTGNHTDDGDTLVPLPFPFKLYGQTFNSVNVNSNGRLDFVVANEPVGYVTACLPAPANQGPYDNTIFGLWEDLRTDAALSGCAGFPGGQCGIFTSVSGVAPDRIFNIEWRTVLFNNNASRHNFEVRLYENSAASNLRFDVVYGSLDTTGFNHPYVAGVQGASGFVTQDFCNTPPPQNVSRTYALPACAASTVISAASRLTHPGAGDQDINLPLTGTTGVECRSGGATNDYTMVVTFASNVSVTGTPQAQVTLGTGTVGSGGVSNGGAVTVAGNVVTIPLTNVADQQTINVTLSSVNLGIGAPAADIVIPMSRLLGDTNGNRVVNSTDVAQTKAAIGQFVTSANFRADVNVSGTFNAGDVGLVKANINHFVP